MSNPTAKDAVARFHLGNGARVERINWAGDLSAKGMKQSDGLMVNYLYDSKRLKRRRQGAAAWQNSSVVSGGKLIFLISISKLITIGDIR